MLVVPQNFVHFFFPQAYKLLWFFRKKFVENKLLTMVCPTGNFCPHKENKSCYT